MPIVRGHHVFDEQFTQVPNAWLRDDRISLKAKGLLAQLLSHRPGWSVTVRSLALANRCGLDAIRTAVQELEQAGYLRRRQERSTAGQFGEITWETTDPEATVTGKPLSDNPTTGNPIHKKNISKEQQDKETSAHREAFDQFWEAYPRKVGKAEALKVFLRLAGDHSAAILAGAIRLARDPNLPATQFVPYPATWLNRSGWEDEPYPERILSKEEKAEKERQEYLEREAARKERQRLQRIADEEERIKREKEREENPIEFCEHQKILYRCEACWDWETDQRKK